VKPELLPELPRNFKPKRRSARFDARQRELAIKRRYRDSLAAYVVVPVAGHLAVGESQVQVHAMPVAGFVVVKPGPRAGREQVIAHEAVCTAKEGNSKPQTQQHKRRGKTRNAKHETPKPCPPASRIHFPKPAAGSKRDPTDNAFVQIQANKSKTKDGSVNADRRTA
jgi:hypothetical protein